VIKNFRHNVALEKLNFSADVKNITISRFAR
jgi:hypothetical protein